MLPFKLVYSEDYYLPIGAHVFPAQKYRLIHQRLLDLELAQPADFVAPAPADDADVLLVHTPEYVRKLKEGKLSPSEELQMEVPYSPELVRAFWLAAGGSIQAAELALRDGIGINLGGGFHHAFSDHGEGFCMIHDVAIAIRRLQKDGKIARAMVVDCDVHQGNGTAAIFGRPELTAPSQSISYTIAGMHQHEVMTEMPAADVFTVSLHQHANYPAWKPPSSIDVNLPDGCTDSEYLGWLDNALRSALRHFPEPQFLCYLAGADPYREDQLGGLGLSIEGLQRRDEFVFHFARKINVPVMVTFAGGYARNTNDTVKIHCNTVAAARDACLSK
jgi:acetoin utilization deacetylase AcuC-like enzyme